MFPKSKRYRRRSTRLKGYDYASPGSYFVTLNCIHRQCLFGDIVSKRMVLNDLGWIAHLEWLKTALIRPNIDVGPFIIMPDHIHGIITILFRSTYQYSLHKNKTGQVIDRFTSSEVESSDDSHSGNNSNRLISTSQTIGAIIRGYMGAVTSQINLLRNTPGEKVWQRNYHDRIIRNEHEYYAIANYIKQNPAKWDKYDFIK